MMMSKMIVMVGLPGSGKSSIVKKLITKDTFVYSTDDYIEEASAVEGKTYAEGFADHIKNATKIMNEHLSVALDAGVTVIWDQTNLSKKKRAKIIARANQNFYKSYCKYIHVSESDAQIITRRLNNRPGKIISGHVYGVMKSSFQYPTIAEGFADVEIYDINGTIYNNFA